jgi:hypothetical protein
VVVAQRANFVNIAKFGFWFSNGGSLSLASLRAPWLACTIALLRHTTARALRPSLWTSVHPPRFCGTHLARQCLITR